MLASFVREKNEVKKVYLPPPLSLSRPSLTLLMLSSPRHFYFIRVIHAVIRYLHETYFEELSSFHAREQLHLQLITLFIANNVTLL